MEHIIQNNTLILCYLYITYHTSNILHYVLWSQPIVLLLGTIISIKSTMFELLSITHHCCDLCNLFTWWLYESSH